MYYVTMRLYLGLFIGFVCVSGQGARARPKASHQTAHILFLANGSADDFFIDALLQFASVTM